MITVYGASDDLIEVDGDAGIREEFYAVNDATNLLAFSCGVVLEVEYTDRGLWRITPLAGADKVETRFATDPDGDYSDVATVQQRGGWVVHGVSFAIAQEVSS